jgi:hypothetical protein
VEIANVSSDLQTLNGYTVYYLQYNWHGDTVVWVASDGGGNNTTTLTTDPWGVYSSDTLQYYLWNGGWGYMYFNQLKLYYVHGRWYNPETGLWLSPDEKGEYLYGSGQDAVNYAWVGDGGYPDTTEFILQWMHDQNKQNRLPYHEFLKKQIDFLRSREHLTQHESSLLETLEISYAATGFDAETLAMLLIPISAGESINNIWADSPTAILQSVAQNRIANAATNRAYFQRVQQLMAGEPGYNVSPEGWFHKYQALGPGNRTAVTDKRAITRAIGEFEGRGNTITVTRAQANALAEGLGIDAKSLWNGFRISKIEGIAQRTPASTWKGNEFFLGPGKGLPSGGPDLTISGIPTNGGPGIQQIIVIVR